MTYREAMDRFGSDKPDLRFGIELTELTDYFTDTPFRVFQAPYVGAVVMPGGGSQPRRAFDAWQDWAKSRGARGLAYVTVGDDGELGGPVAKNISDPERAGLVEAVGAKPGDCVFFAAGQRRSSQELLGAARNEIARRLDLIEPGSWSFLFVVDFPMFEQTEDGDWTFMHHPFTSPTPEWRDRFAEDKAAALSDAYDMVINGNEVMSGSVRIHDAGLQERVFETLGMSREEARERFGRAGMGPALGSAGRRRLHPRGHRLSEDRCRLRPADRSADADHGGPAQGGGDRRRAGGAAAARRARGPRPDGPDPLRGRREHPL
jgi:aspartyl-tRNA synthetase